VSTLKQITPKDIRRSRGGAAESWKTIIERYRGRIEKYHWRYEPMLVLVESLASSAAAKELFPTTSMSQLLITDTDQFYHNDNVLFISYNADKREFEFEHRTLSAKNDKKVCSADESLQILSLFLKYKFGVLFDPKHSRKRHSSV
jgi:hypothetical protein